MYDKKMAEGEVIRGPGPSMAEELGKAEVVVFGRSMSDQIMAMVKSLQAHRKRVVFDEDDNFFSVQPYSPHFKDLGVMPVDLHFPNGVKQTMWQDGKGGSLAWLLVLTGFLLVTGLGILLLPFSKGTQVTVLAHTAGGLLFLVPFLWYLVPHFRERFRDKSYLEGLTVEEVSRLAQECYREAILPRLSPSGLACVREHQCQGHRIVLLTGSLAFLLSP